MPTMRVLLAGALFLGLASFADAEGRGREKWFKKAGLTEEQRGKVKEAFKAEREASKPLRRELRDAVQKLEDAVEDEAGDKALETALTRVEKARNALEAQREKSHAKLASLFTPAQRAKMVLRRARHMEGREGRWARGGGRHDKAEDDDKEDEEDDED